MHIQSLALLAVGAIAAETVTLFLPGFDAQSIDGKILGHTGTTTSYLINCAAGSDADDCGIPDNGVTVTQGNSMAILSYTYDEATISESCKYDSTALECSFSLNESGTVSESSVGIPLTEVPGNVFLPVHITATEAVGASATTGASASASTAVSTGASALTTSASTSGDTSAASDATTTSPGGGSSDSTSAAATSQTKTGNAAVPIITGNARRAAGGVAAALAFAAL